MSSVTGTFLFHLSSLSFSIAWVINAGDSARLRLNNFCQYLGKKVPVDYEFSKSGPANQELHTAQAISRSEFINTFRSQANGGDT